MTMLSHCSKYTVLLMHTQQDDAFFDADMSTTGSVVLLLAMKEFLETEILLWVQEHSMFDH